jgi:hypothetical protein
MANRSVQKGGVVALGIWGIIAIIAAIFGVFLMAA